MLNIVGRQERDKMTKKNNVSFAVRVISLLLAQCSNPVAAHVTKKTKSVNAYRYARLQREGLHSW